MIGWVACNDLWSFTNIFKVIEPWSATRLLTYGTSCCGCSIAPTVLNGFFHIHICLKWSLSKKGCVMLNDLWPQPIFSKSLSHDFVIKLLKYGTYFCDRSTACTVLDGFSPYLALMITTMRVSCNDLWPWPTSSKLFSSGIAYFMDYIHMFFTVWAGGILVDHWSTISSSYQILKPGRGIVRYRFAQSVEIMLTPLP